jgi:hypothetical protein
MPLQTVLPIIGKDKDAYKVTTQIANLCNCNDFVKSKIETVLLLKEVLKNEI